MRGLLGPMTPRRRLLATVVAVLTVATASVVTAVNADASTAPPAQAAGRPTGVRTMMVDLEGAAAAAAGGPCVITVDPPTYDPWGDVYAQADISCPIQVPELRIGIYLTVNGYYEYDSLNYEDLIATYSIDVLSNPVGCWPGEWVAHVSAYIREADGSVSESPYVGPPESLSC